MSGVLELIRCRKSELIERAELAIEMEEAGEVSPGELQMIAAELGFLLVLMRERLGELEALHGELDDDGR